MPRPVSIGKSQKSPEQIREMFLCSASLFREHQIAGEEIELSHTRQDKRVARHDRRVAQITGEIRDPRTGGAKSTSYPLAKRVLTGVRPALFSSLARVLDGAARLSSKDGA